MATTELEKLVVTFIADLKNYKKGLKDIENETKQAVSVVGKSWDVVAEVVDVAAEKLEKAKLATQRSKLAAQKFGMTMGIIGMGFQQMGGGISKTGASMKRFFSSMFSQVVGASEGLTKLKKEITDTFGEVFKQVGEALIPVLKPVVEYVKKFGEYFKSLSPEFKKVVGVAIMLGIAFGTILTFIGPLISAFGSLIVLIGALPAIFSFIASGGWVLIPIFAILAAGIAAITGALFALYAYVQQNPALLKMFSIAGEKMKEFGKKFLGFIANFKHNVAVVGLFFVTQWKNIFSDILQIATKTFKQIAVLPTNAAAKLVGGEQIDFMSGMKLKTDISLLKKLKTNMGEVKEEAEKMSNAILSENLKQEESSKSYLKSLKEQVEFFGWSRAQIEAEKAFRNNDFETMGEIEQAAKELKAKEDLLKVQKRAKALTEQYLTPLEKFRKIQKELADLKKMDNGISQETHDRALKAAEKQLESALDLKKAKEAVLQLDKSAVRLGSSEHKRLQGLAMQQANKQGKRIGQKDAVGIAAGAMTALGLPTGEKGMKVLKEIVEVLKGMSDDEKTGLGTSKAYEMAQAAFEGAAEA